MTCSDRLFCYSPKTEVSRESSKCYKLSDLVPDSAPPNWPESPYTYNSQVYFTEEVLNNLNIDLMSIEWMDETFYSAPAYMLNIGGKRSQTLPARYHSKYSKMTVRSIKRMKRLTTLNTRWIAITFRQSQCTMVTNWR